MRGERAERSYVGRRARLLDLYLSRARPLLVDPESYVYSTRSAAEEARRIVDVADDRRATLAFSADLAPDLLVPWRHATVTVVYTSDRLTLDGARFVLAEGRADASVVLRWTSDDTLLTHSPWWPGSADGIPVTDPVQQRWDLLDLGGEDRVEAADRLRCAILDRAIPRAT